MMATKETAALSTMSFSTALPTVVTEEATLMTAWREEEEDKKCKVKRPHFFSKKVGFFLERENKFFLGRNNKILSCLEKKSNGYSLEG